MSKVNSLLVLIFILTGCSNQAPSSFVGGEINSNLVDQYITNLEEINSDNVEVKIVEVDEENIVDVSDGNEEIIIEVKSDPEEGAVEVASDDRPNLIPPTLNLKVPFAPQAPYAVWDNLHQEACEEASMEMARAYFNNDPLNPHLMEQSILKQVKWQEENGYSIDLTAVEVKNILEEYFKLTASISADMSVDSFKRHLSQGKLIIVPAAGRELGNPNFTGEGPIYHMLVIRGYDEKNFITNDPGTRKGEGFIYSQKRLIDAIHDWPKDLEDGVGKITAEQIKLGKKIVVIVEK